MNTFLSYKELTNSIKQKKISFKEYYETLQQKIISNDKEINSFITVNEKVLDQASEADIRIANGTNRLLEGMPLAVKDNIAVYDMKLTCGSKMLENFTPPYQATVIDRLQNAGIIFTGKTNMDEFAMGSTTETSHFGVTKNPVNHNFVPGGSSGGSAAAVAAGFSPAALGSDTGGSVRQPASFCGIVGYKPTYGLLSRYGLTAFGSSLDQIGTLSLNCEDAALLTASMLGLDSKDSTSSSIVPENFYNFQSITIKGKKFGIIAETMSEHTDPQVKSIINAKIKEIEKHGGIAEVVSIPELEYGVSIYYIIAPAEASSNLSRFDGIRYGLQNNTDKNIDVKTLVTKTRTEGFGSEVKRRIITGNFVLSSGYYDAYYKKAQKARILLSDKFKSLFNTYDFLITPTSPVLPFKLGENIDDPLKLYTADLCTIPVNLSGLPAISIPAGVSKEGLPVGMQIIAPSFKDGKLLGIGEYILREVK
ncbi:MAG: glutaminyl-tRNA synthase (glutamine-hydrolyzing) subunit A [Spirochaetes bacterium GWF1_31_7]|nr:MAG: glutaminyl-tRNA synthase (glutamine-hydrolyzing) subunit A [Spirochaetes bacterium GWE1_32_154]OHD48833.1 MAG: glutaminyl-tRNA synthase (glutamine-hydrolyzing) subunit A [Spirochaetes bacterium GWF1_31_7]OHD78029.1 MAG: glutaminyl-tRNA synthase (glutamine-hydrolyzing) subunit A [Spirochaetes bacterium RIFOXYB1_FULL_32_8]HBD92649.1 Asp-tRNA(Asn)/Glu-tRNA(Gln) amidotransferase GatCAB subunit A [Spirochaetia bacterium]HBI36868.1 Asp-tRNA(Asn)/Glu-tRNA(Gln) amidotransferase GatCAB subunit A